MTKRELIELLEEVDNDATIGAWWDDSEWPILALTEGDDFDYIIHCP